MQAAIFGRNKKRKRGEVEGLEEEDMDDFERRKRERIAEREQQLNSQDDDEMEQQLLEGTARAREHIKLKELAEEGATQIFMPMRNNDLILGAVGVLQFDVVASRLLNEYKVECVYEPISVATARWVHCHDDKKLEEFKRKARDSLSLDGGGYLTYLAPSMVNLSLTQERWPDIEFRKTREH